MTYENERAAAPMGLGGPGSMLLSAVIFGYFGFLYGMDWSSPGVDGEPVFFRLLAGWTLQGSAIAYFLCAGVTLLKRIAGNLLYSIVGLLGAAGLVVVVILDTLDPQHGLFNNSTIIFLLFAAWNGFGSWQGLRVALMFRRISQANHTSPYDRSQ